MCCAPAAPVAARSCRPDPVAALAPEPTTVPIRRLTRSSQFLAANGGVRVPMPAFVLLVRPRGDDDPAAGYGITATKRLGGAVIRNRVKRRFRALVRELFPANAMPGADHVLIGRADALILDAPRLRADLAKALGKAARRVAEREGSALP